MAPKKRNDTGGRDSLLEAIEGDYPEAFMFTEPGTLLVGRVKGFSKGFSSYGPHPVVIVQNEADGEEVSVHCLHTALRKAMQDADPKAGDRVAIKYVGEAVAKGGRNAGKTYKDFRVRVDSPTRTFSDIMDSIGEDDLPF